MDWGWRNRITVFQQISVYSFYWGNWVTVSKYWSNQSKLCPDPFQYHLQHHQQCHRIYCQYHGLGLSQEPGKTPLESCINIICNIMKEKKLVDLMVVLDCVANIMVIGAMLTTFPIRVWNDEIVCLVISFYRTYVFALNR